MRAAGIRAATSIAASRSSASKQVVAADASLVSAKGPSVVSVWPSCTRTVVAVSGRCSWCPPSTPGVWAIFMYSPVSALFSSSESASYSDIGLDEKICSM